MTEFLSENSLYLVLGIVLLIWLGIFLYVLKLDKKITKLEHQLTNQD